MTRRVRFEVGNVVRIRHTDIVFRVEKVSKDGETIQPAKGAVELSCAPDPPSFVACFCDLEPVRRRRRS